jgi:GMP synthase (glutamine-hydrolysing)
MYSRLRFLLLQVRNNGDPMRRQEVACFARALRVDEEQIHVHDLLAGAPSGQQLHAHDMVLLGGSGHYSAIDAAEWIEGALDAMRDLCARAKPTFASCWGFQAMARAMGGTVVHDLERAEVGTHLLELSGEGREDPVFGPLGPTFEGQMGHEYHVTQLPEGATLLASTRLVENQAYRFEGLPIYCTQFHPELNRENLLERVLNYPEYIERIAGLPPERFSELLRDTPQTEALLRRFVELVFGD